MMEVNFDGLDQPLCEYHNESMDALPELWDESSVCFDPSDLAVELRDEDGCNSPIWSTLVPTDDDEDAVACRMTNSAQVVLHDRLITDTTTSFKKCTATAPLPSLPSLIFCPSTSHRRTDQQQQQQHSVYSITIDSRGQVEIVQDTTKPSSKSCIIIPDDPLSLGIKAEPASPAESLTDDDDEDEDDDYSEEDEGQCNQSSRKRSLPPPSARNQPATKLIKSELGNNNRLAPFPSAAATSNTVNFVLPPTPPSSASSDNEGGNVSPVRDVNSPKLDEGGSSEQQRRSATTTTSNRHPINSPLISYQPKGSTGVLQLTDEEKRTLLAEGYPVPTRLPLTKAEEKSLKKIRRKIKNKISAQESRRKKKEYMDTLERRAQELVDENADYRQRLVQLETDNAALQVQLKRLQKLLNTKADNNSSHQHDLLED